MYVLMYVDVKAVTVGCGAATPKLVQLVPKLLQGLLAKWPAVSEYSLLLTPIHDLKLLFFLFILSIQIMDEEFP